MRFKRFKRRHFYSILFLIYLGVMFLGGCADKLLLYPSTRTISAPGSKARVIRLSTGAVQLWEQEASHVSRAQVLGFPGNAMRAEEMISDMAYTWQSREVSLTALNYPGFGASTGPARLSSISIAALSAYDDLAARHPGEPIYLEGISIGTAAALYVAAHRPCAGILLYNPPPLAQLIRGHYGWWNLWLAALPVSWQVPGALDSLNNAARVHVPAIFVVADRDTVVPPRYHQMVIDAYGGPREIINLAGADHNDPPSPLEEGQISAALARWLPTARATTQP